MTKSTNSFDWSVGEEPFDQLDATDSIRSQSAQQTTRRSGTPLFKIASAIAVVLAISMAASGYLSTTPDPPLPKTPDLPAPEPSVIAQHAQALSDSQQRVLQEEAVGSILALELSMEMGPELMERMGSLRQTGQSHILHNRLR